ncbi:MAG: NAD(P)H-quinone oxidoreductase subunit 4, partial [Fischerella sp.]|nr:NAD(P)H-quinone oxidoreductase subunit 4 [Fischerella sp.]
GLYPKLVTQTYDVKTVEVAAHARQFQSVVAQQQPSSLYSRIFPVPTLARSEMKQSGVFAE